VASVGSSGQPFAVLGDMLELGDDAEQLHVALGREAARRGLSGVAAVGEMAPHVVRGARDAGLARVLATPDPIEAAKAVASWSGTGDWILVKASRGLQLERAVEALESLLGSTRERRATQP
jgi:UDP-N-acetylmuramoyl-tripeptide--D-alanyl-D-alanine ligase